MWEREFETEQNCNILTPTLIAISVSFSRSPGLLNRRPRGRTLCWVLVFSTISYLQLVWSPKLSRGPEGSLCWVLASSTASCLQTDWISCYITVHTHSISPHNWPSEYALPPSLEWHVWSSSSGNNCHAVHRSLSSGASVCDCTVGF